jgi:hypothetical protein
MRVRPGAKRARPAVLSGRAAGKRRGPVPTHRPVRAHDSPRRSTIRPGRLCALPDTELVLLSPALAKDRQCDANRQKRGEDG